MASKFSEKSKIFYPALYFGLLVLVLDALSKYFVHAYVQRMQYDAQWYPYRGIGVFKNFFGVEFSVVHATNRGAAWGVLADYQDPLLYARVVFIVGLFAYLVFFNRTRGLVFPLVLIIAGAFGNIVDYFLYGHVVDMFHCVFWGYDYPVFNIADSSIFVGVSWILLRSVLLQKKSHSDSTGSKCVRRNG